jgi:DNA (cytosine-5)-methyltransferase 1
MRERVDELTAIDLFSGAGALTLGLKQAGFRVVAGVEISKEISKTYKANHRKTVLLTKDIRQVTGKELLGASGLKKITMIAGCPPCQGFSSLTSKYRREDSRNDLALEMARIIVEVKPEMVMMENVPGIMKKGKPFLDKFVARLRRHGYRINMDVLQLADYGIPQTRRRFVLLAGKGFKIALPKQTHCLKGNERKGLTPWLKVADIIKGTKKPVTLHEAIKKGGPEKFNWHIVRNLTKISLQRLASIKAGGSSRNVPKKLRPKCHADRKIGFQNVYGRMSWNQTPPTITSGCTTPCMGRFGHPTQKRTISIREAALIQTFPDSFKFKTEYMDWACTMVGNALPPKFAEIAAKHALTTYRQLPGNSLG